jgi:hypothetical protein
MPMFKNNESLGKINDFNVSLKQVKHLDQSLLTICDTNVKHTKKKQKINKTK